MEGIEFRAFQCQFRATFRHSSTLPTLTLLHFSKPNNSNKKSR